ncbi:hypothetical protein [Nesterenkonia sp.]|uniref:hypothetical protein n=1 Tax=Nesterenkonia sp. TaxID=704201 RepID=UPI002606AE1C|nr:hypothetical protein [Nesterenkonia sp.]
MPRMQPNYASRDFDELPAGKKLLRALIGLGILAAVVVLLLFILVGCSSQDPSDNKAETPISEAEAPAVPAAGPFEEGAPDEALVIFDDPVPDVVPAPNGEMWDLHGSFDMDILRGYFDATVHMEAGETSCEEALYYWLREDGYGTREEAGPTCFGEGGGRVPSEELRRIHYVCQAPNTTAQTLVMPTSKGNEPVASVFTPEHTTGDHWECFDFNGETVEADQTVVSSVDE